MFRPRRHSKALSLALLVSMGVVSCACDKGADSAESKDAAGEGELGAKIESEIVKGVDGTDVDTKTKDEVKSFLKDQRKKGCEMLTPALAARVLEVPEGDLKQMKVMGCIYSAKSDEQVAEASIMTIFVKESPEKAKTWFGNMTKNKTPEELAAEMAKVKEMAKKSDMIDTDAKKKGVDQVGGIINAMTPDDGYQYEDVPGVGDAARVKTYDGQITVLVGNMVFNVRAFKGAPSPEPDMKELASGDVKRIMAATKKVEAQWMDTTRDERKAYGVKLAKAIVAEL